MNMKAFVAISLLSLLLLGCSNGGDAAVETPKGPPPNTVEAPPGTKTPDQIALEREKQNAAGGASTQDGGGQDGT